MVMGGIVPVVNLDGIKPGDLVLDGPTLAEIFLGNIKKWNDPAIAKLNPASSCRRPAIAVVHRSDGSGTTFNFTNYLSDVSPDWKGKVGANTAVQWPVGIGAKGNEGVADNVGQTKGSIGYVEYAYAKQNKMTYTKMVNKDGKTVVADRRGLPGRCRQRRLEERSRAIGVILTNQPGARLWPITAATFILIYKKPADAAAADEALKFFAWAYAKGDEHGARTSTTCRCPTQCVSDVKKIWAADIKDATASRSSPADALSRGDRGKARRGRRPPFDRPCSAGGARCLKWL